MSRDKHRNPYGGRRARMARFERRWHGPPPHMRHRPPFKRGGAFFFLWFLAIFGVITLVFVVGLGSIVYLLQQVLGQNINPNLLLVSAIAAALLISMAIFLSRLARKRITSPLADFFRVIEAVGEGDFSVRISERPAQSFGPLGRALNNMVQELENTDLLRRNLTADVAHELNTPLHIIQGYLEGIQDGIYQADEETIGIMLDETQLLGRLVTDLRTLSLAEGGQLPLEIELLELAELVNDISTSFSGQAEAAGIKLSVDVLPGLQVYGDADRLEQVLGNLVVNALRHTASGGQISITAGPVEGDVRLTVSDNGEGIATEELPFIFDRFWRGDRSRQHTEGGGHGLGLAIARQLVRAHGGQIEVESKLGEGTRFEITLPGIEN